VGLSHKWTLGVAAAALASGSLIAGGVGTEAAAPSGVTSRPVSTQPAGSHNEPSGRAALEQGGSQEKALRRNLPRFVAKWPMTTVGAWSRNLVAGPDLHFAGNWRPAPGRIGQAVRFTAAPAFGAAPRSEAKNPGPDDFAFGAMFTSRPIFGNYTGNLMQKGFWDSRTQLKMELIPQRGGTVHCRVKGLHGEESLISRVIVDEGRWHKAVCWRVGARVGLTVDNRSSSVAWRHGAISNTATVRLGNKNLLAGRQDQHFGKVDCAVYVLGAHARARALNNMPC